MSGKFTALSASRSAKLEIVQRSDADGLSLDIHLGRDGNMMSAVFTTTDLEAAGIHITLERPFPTGDHAVIELNGVRYSHIPDSADDTLPWASRGDSWDSEKRLREIEKREGVQHTVLFEGVAA